MLDFSYKTFKDYLKKPIEKNEIDFLIKTFSRSCVYFFFYMIFLSTLGVIFSSSITNNRVGWCVLSFLICFFSSIAFMFGSYKYARNPLGVSHSTVSMCWTLMFITFTSSFFALYSLVVSSGTPTYFLPLSSVIIFSITIFLYSIPVGIAMYIKNKETVVSLLKFLKICLIIYGVVFAVFLISVLWSFFSGRKFEVPGLGTAIFIFACLITFIAPIITIYRMKTIVPYINYEDSYERTRWQNFFVFQIVQELLQIAFTVAKILIRFCGRCGSRLGS